MTGANSTNLMDTEPGGEQTQYEGAKTFMQPPAKDGGQLGASSSNSAGSEVKWQTSQEKGERDEETAENQRSEEAISEHGFGGETTSSSGQAHQTGYGRVAEAQDEDRAQSRSAQGYGPGSGVGA